MLNTLQNAANVESELEKANTSGRAAKAKALITNDVHKVAKDSEVVHLIPHAEQGRTFGSRLLHVGE